MSNFRYVNGIRIFSYKNFDELINDAVSNKSILVAMNSDKTQYASEKLKDIINNNIGYCDGVGAVWALKQKGLKDAVKLAGCELWLEIIKKFPTSKYYLIGAEQEVIDSVITKLKRQFQGINIVGYRNGFFKSEEEMTSEIEKIKAANPDFVFVAMGSPKQEFFLNDIHNVVDVPMMGLGGSFNVYTGKVNRAPEWMLKLNLETLYRYIFCGIKFSRMKSDFKFLVKLLFHKF